MKETEYNDGKHTFVNTQDMKPEEREKLAHEFCEGSIELKRLLLTLWNEGIETCGCCTGEQEFHKDRKFGDDETYIGMDIKDSDDRKKIYHMLIEPIRRAEYDYRIDFNNIPAELGARIEGSVSIRTKQKTEQLGIITQQDADKFFKSLNDCIEQYKTQDNGINL